MSGVLRVIDFGQVSPLRSQTLWHAVAYGVSAGQPVTLSFARPAAPYVCLGYHRDLAEVDLDYCRFEQLPVYRRMVGGGPVYLDDRQLFFQICLPAAAVPPSRVAALRDLLAPAAAAFRGVGIAGSLDDDGEICLGDAKICGHGAGQIEDAVVICGNLITEFDHDRATAVLALPDPVQREQTRRLMRRYVRATPADPAAFVQALAGAYSSALGLPASTGELSDAESAAADRLDQRFTDPRWLAGPGGTTGRAQPGRQVKIRAGIWTFTAQAACGARLAASVIRGRIDRAALTAPWLNGQVRAAELALAGAPVCAAVGILDRHGFGQPGRELAAALVGAEARAR